MRNPLKRIDPLVLAFLASVIILLVVTMTPPQYKGHDTVPIRYSDRPLSGRYAPLP